MSQLISSLRCDGRLNEARQRGEMLLARTGAADREVCNNLFWVYYDQGKLIARSESATSSAIKDLLFLTSTMQGFMHFFSPDGMHARAVSKLRRMTVRTAMRMARKDTRFNFIEFLLRIGLACFNPDDWKPRRGTDGKIYDGDACRALRMAFARAKTSRSGLKEWGKRLLPLFEEASQIAPQDQWIMRDHALLLIRLGRRDEAWKILKQLEQKMGRSHYYWCDLADCLTEPEDKVVMLCRAISVSRNESFLRPVRLELSGLLLYLGLKAEARTELDRYLGATTPGMKCARKAQQLHDVLRDQPPAPDGNASLYAAKSSMATVLLYSKG